jgi:hypothetical protein
MRHHLVPEFPTRRPVRPLMLPGTTLVVTFVVLALTALVVAMLTMPLH